MERLSGAVDTSARAGHYLNEVIRAVAGLYLLHNHTCVLESVNYGYLQVDHSRDRNGGLTYAFQTADFLEVNLWKGLAGEDLCSCTESSLHNATGCAEDDGCTCRLAKRRVELGLRKVVEVNVAHLNEACKLAGGD